MPYKCYYVNPFPGKMGKNQIPEPSGEELRELSIGLLQEWWLTSTQALVDEAGSVTMLQVMKPHILNNGRFAAQYYLKSVPNPKRDLADVAKGTLFWPARRSGGPHSRVTVKQYADGATCEFLGCTTSGISKEACILYCELLGTTVAEGINPDFSFTMKNSLSAGDQFCFFELGPKKGSQFYEGEPLVLKDYMTHEEREFWRLAACGEWWTMTTRGFIDFAGSDEALKKLRFYMRHSGLSVGTRLATKIKVKNPDAKAIGTIVAQMGSFHQRKEEDSTGENCYEANVTECPFSGGPSEICSQYEAFFNGMCEAIDPSYEFAYDRMMTKGDKTCHWTIKKKGEAAKEKPEEDDALKALRLRFAKGEISKEEYLEMKETLEG
jgi:hypothetical protein